MEFGSGYCVHNDPVDGIGGECHCWPRVKCWRDADGNLWDKPDGKILRRRIVVTETRDELAVPFSEIRSRSIEGYGRR